VRIPAASEREQICERLQKVEENNRLIFRTIASACLGCGKNPQASFSDPRPSSGHQSSEDFNAARPSKVVWGI
jgi:hypothetical protein